LKYIGQGQCFLLHALPSPGAWIE